MKCAYKLLIIIFLISPLAIGQSLQKLDDKNGFRDFKFGSPYSSWASQLTFQKITDAQISLYNYNGGCCESFLGVKIESINLGFSKNKLDQIIIKLDKNNSKDISFKLKEYRTIIDKLILEFGKPSNHKSDADTGEIKTYWHGNKVSMALYNLYGGYEIGAYNYLILVVNPKQKNNIDGL